MLLAGVGDAPDEQVEANPGAPERRKLAQRGGEEPRLARRPEGRLVPGDEEDEVVTGERQGAGWQELLAEDGDRALAAAVDVRPRAPGRGAARPLRLDVQLELPQTRQSGVSQRVVAESGEERAAAGEQPELPRDNGSAAGRLLRHAFGMHDLPRLRHVRHAGELDPLDMAHDGASHDPAPSHVSTMMGMVTHAPIPPFERFYLAHRDEVLGYLRRLLGQRAEDAWQETFLRALRAYDRLQHGRHLRAWVFTIATNVAMDELRAKPVNGLREGDEPAVELRQDAFRELEHLTDDLPPTERAAVVLRYGYDLPYAQIADALGSSEDAARAAASSGVRRLRREHAGHA